MALHAGIRSLLQQLTANPPNYENDWYGPWFGLLNQIFPGCIVFRQYRIERSDGGPHQIPDFVVCRLVGNVYRIICVVEIKNTWHWPDGRRALRRQINRQTDAAFDGSGLAMAWNRVYWISVIGPRWQYGYKDDDGQPPTPLIRWRARTHCPNSYQDLLNLAALIALL